MFATITTLICDHTEDTDGLEPGFYFAFVEDDYDADTLVEKIGPYPTHEAALEAAMQTVENAARAAYGVLGIPLPEGFTVSAAQADGEEEITDTVEDEEVDFIAEGQKEVFPLVDDTNGDEDPSVFYAKPAEPLTEAEIGSVPLSHDSKEAA